MPKASCRTRKAAQNTLPAPLSIKPINSLCHCHFSQSHYRTKKYLVLPTEAGLAVPFQSRLVIMKVLSATHLKLGQKIKKLRGDLAMTQEDLAFKVGVDRSYMGFLERGEKNPTLSTVIKIAKVLKVPIKELFD